MEEKVNEETEKLGFEDWRENFREMYKLHVSIF